MNLERWQQIDSLLQTALAREPAKRAAFLDQECSNDEDLRAEVESLLSSTDNALDLIDKPVFEFAAPLFVAQRELAEGQSIAQYRIVSFLGAGGMGEVYLAQDTKLGRKVALKLLPTDYILDEKRLLRFEQEARAASALNHPNILTIYEIASVEDRQFIATEFVEGETLRQRLKPGPLSQVETLDIAIQVAGALAAAHKAGIVHRDIKPENIMIRPDGYVKVLDFGLAKLAESFERIPDTRAATNTDMSSGLVMGTVKYMSPEQAQGRPVDSRSDIFSFGVVLYEMLTGRSPFKGEAAKDVVKSILEDEPKVLSEFLPEAPVEIERIIVKALRKDRAERYQLAAELLNDLKKSRQHVELHSGNQTMPHASSDHGVPTEESWPTRTTMTENVIGQITPRRAIATIFATIILAVAGLVGIYTVLKGNRPQSASQSMNLSRLTTSGNVMTAAISPDGQQVVCVINDRGQQSIRLRQLATSETVTLFDRIDSGRVEELTFSPDGTYIYYRVRDKNTQIEDLYQIALRGGEARKVMSDVDSPVTFSPDGKRLAFTRHNNPVVGQSNLLTANPDGTSQETLSTRQSPEIFLSPAWSPDGTTIVCGIGLGEGASLATVRVQDGAFQPLGSQKWRNIGRIGWIAGGRALVLTAQSFASSKSQVWQITYPAGEMSRLTNDLASYNGMSLPGDSGTIAVVQSAFQSSLSIAPAERPEETKIITNSVGSSDGARGLSWAPNGNIIYASDATGNSAIWSVDAAGAPPKQLTVNTDQNYHPTVTPDGRYIVFVSDHGGAARIWRMDINGSNPIQLTTGKLDRFPSCAPDSKWVVYHSVSSSGVTTLWKISIDGGEPEQLIDKWANRPSVSPDGKWIAFQHWSYRGSGPTGFLSLIPFERGQITEVGPLGDTLRLRWTPDGKAIAFVKNQDGVSNLWAMPINGGSLTQLTDFKSEQIYWFDWSPDGKYLALARGIEVSDVVLITNFR